MRRIDMVWGLALAASSVVAASLWRELQEERALTAQLRARHDFVTQSPPPAPGSTTQTSSVASATAETPTRAASSTSHMDSAQAGDNRPEDWRAYQHRLLQDPKYREALREQRRLTYRLRRDNAIRLFGLSPATADAIIELDIDREFQMQELNPEPATEEEHRQQKAQYEADDRDHESKLLALLGQQRFDRWQNYMETRGTRMQVDRFRSQLDGAEMLRDDQVEPLIAALAVEQKQLQADLEEFSAAFSWEGDRTERNRKFSDRQAQIIAAGNKRMLESAGSVLSASQIKRLGDMLSTDLAQRANQLRLDALRQKLGPTPGTEPGPN
jgi:hypothetical protein